MARAPIAVIVVADSITMPTVSERTLEYRVTTPPLAATRLKTDFKTIARAASE
jgi:hypothetical protein